MPKPAGRSQSLTSQESYSAVIIADLVAEVPVPPDEELVNGRKSSVSKTKDETNLGYDGQMDDGTTEPAVVKLDAMETVDLGSMKANGSRISKGVILNAVQFSQPDSKLKRDLEKNEKAIALKHTMQISDVRDTSKTDNEPSGFSDMSLSRKIVFGFSFLPSVMFVLCFAIILPCEPPPVPQPCVQEMWSKILNDTDVSEIKVPNNGIFTFEIPGEKSDTGVMGIDIKTGNEIWQGKISLKSRYMDCGEVETPGRDDCLIMDDAGSLYVYNSSSGNLIWKRDIRETLVPSIPVILPDCNNDSIAEVAMAVSKTKIKVLYNGNIVSSIVVPDCESIPSRLTAWSRNGTTDLIYTCQKGENEILVKMPQNVWCTYDKSGHGKSVTLTSRALGALSKSTFQPTDNGLAVWAEDEVLMLESNGSLRWRKSTTSHSSQNRFVLYGKFNGEGNQLALFSSDLTTNFSVTTLNSANGSTTWSKAVPNVEVSDVNFLHGKDKDFALVLSRKLKKDLTTEAVAHLNDVSTTIISFIANEEISGSSYNLTSRGLIEEISFMELDKSDSHTVQERELAYLNGASYKSTITAKAQDSENLMVFILSKLQEDPSQTTQIRRVNVANWDISKAQTSKCILK